jgi:tryptophan 2,3-dioxygenase
MEVEQFLKFRLALYPASGFQSVQYRKIEIASTNLINLVHPQYREYVEKSSLEKMFKMIYWKFGATETDTGEKALTLKRFEEKYKDVLLEWAQKHQETNLWKKYKALPDEEKKDPELIELLKKFDLQVNVEWPLQHYKSAARYLSTKQGDVPATGGTNWQKYLPPRMQRRIFFPELWSEDQLEKWGIPVKE